MLHGLQGLAPARGRRRNACSGKKQATFQGSLKHRSTKLKSYPQAKAHFRPSTPIPIFRLPHLPRPQIPNKANHDPPTRPPPPAPPAPCHRRFHANAGCHRAQHRAAHHGNRAARIAAANAIRRGFLRAHARAADAVKRLVERPLRHPPSVFWRNADFCARLRLVRRRHQFAAAGCRPRGARHWRRDDDPRAALGDGACLRQNPAHQHDELCGDARAHRTDYRADCGRLLGGIRLLALDFFD